MPYRKPIAVAALLVLAAGALYGSIGIAQSVYHFGALSRGNPLHFAELAFSGNSTPLGITTVDTPVRVKGFTPSGAAGWTYDPIPGELTAHEGAEGAYALIFSTTLDVAPGLAAVYEISIWQNGTPLSSCLITTGFDAGIRGVTHVAQPCNVTVEVGDVFHMDVINRTNGQDITVRAATVDAHRV